LFLEALPLHQDLPYFLFYCKEDFFLHNTNLETLKMSETSILLETEKTFDNARLEIGRLPEGLLKSNVNLQTLWWKDYTLLGTKSRLFPARFFESLSKLHRFEYETDRSGQKILFFCVPKNSNFFILACLQKFHLKVTSLDP